MRFPELILVGSNWGPERSALQPRKWKSSAVTARALFY